MTPPNNGPGGHKGPHGHKGPQARANDANPKSPPEHEGPHGHKGSHGSKCSSANTPENAMRSVETVRACLKELSPGRIWSHRAPRGEFEFKGCLTFNNEAVVVLHFSPIDGSVLPKGLHALSEGDAESLGKVTDRLKEIASELSVLEGAEFREPESCWAIPLAHKGRIVAHVKVSADGSTLVPDKKAADEMAHHS